MKLAELIKTINENTEFIVNDEELEMVVIACRERTNEKTIAIHQDVMQREVKSVHIQNGICVADPKTDNLLEVDAISITI